MLVIRYVVSGHVSVLFAVLCAYCREAKAAEIQSLSNSGNNVQQVEQLSAEMQLLEAEGALLQQV